MNGRTGQSDTNDLFEGKVHKSYLPEMPQVVLLRPKREDGQYSCNTVCSKRAATQNVYAISTKSFHPAGRIRRASGSISRNQLFLITAVFPGTTTALPARKLPTHSAAATSHHQFRGRKILPINSHLSAVSPISPISDFPQPSYPQRPETNARPKTVIHLYNNVTHCSLYFGGFYGYVRLIRLSPIDPKRGLCLDKNGCFLASHRDKPVTNTDR